MMGLNVVESEWCFVGNVLCWNGGIFCVVVAYDVIVSDKQG